MEIAEGDIARSLLFLKHERGLATLANHSRLRGMELSEFVILCIDADDPLWRPVVAVHMPNVDWEKFPVGRGKPIIARMVAHAETALAFMKQSHPELTLTLRDPLPPGKVRAFILAHGSASVFHVTPDPNARLLS